MTAASALVLLVMAPASLLGGAGVGLFGAWLSGARLRAPKAGT